MGGGGVRARFLLGKGVKGERGKQGSDKLAKGGDALIMSPVMINSYKLVYFSYF